MKPHLNGMDITDFFGPEEILCRTELVERDELIMALLRVLAERGKITDIDAAFKALLAREELGPSIVAPGIAMPHARSHCVKTIVVAIATSSRGIKFSNEEDGLVKLAILILVPRESPGMYLQAAGAMGEMLDEPGAAERAAALETAPEVWRFFHSGSHKLPDHVCAADIMTRDIITLKEDDTLEHAIDMFARLNLTSLPVLDKNGEIAGMASAAELLRVCLPEHLLWMEDLSPIINFEPFATMLQNEGKTCLQDIMSFDYVTVSEDAPAILVAKEFRKRPARNVLVVRAKRLVGIISLQDFIRKVLRG